MESPEEREPFQPDQPSDSAEGVWEPYEPRRRAKPAQDARESIQPDPPSESTDSGFAIDRGYFDNPSRGMVLPEEPASNGSGLNGMIQDASPPFVASRDRDLGNHYELPPNLVQPTRWSDRTAAPEPATQPAPAPEPMDVEPSASQTPEPDLDTPAAEPVPTYEFFDHGEKNGEDDRKKARPRAVIYVPPVVERPVEVSRSQLWIEKVLRDPRLWIGVLVAGAVVAWMMWQTTRNVGVTSIRTIRRQATAYDGRQVKVRGRVGDVFPMGNSYAFNLVSGRDTLVVFTRSRVPVTRQDVLVNGSISTGTLEGIERPALFESAN